MNGSSFEPKELACDRPGFQSLDRETQSDTEI